MENKNSRSTSNLNQRLQLVAERRAQIEEAKRERVQRQIENVRPMPAPAPFAYTNPTVAFGSTRPRNIDLTRPLVTPIASTGQTINQPTASAAAAAPSNTTSHYQQQSSNSGGNHQNYHHYNTNNNNHHNHGRPKSEIFTSSSIGGTLFANQMATNTNEQSIRPVYSKDDSNYQQQRSSTANNNNNNRTGIGGGGGSGIVPSMTQSMSSGSIQQSYRAVRRHDPELVPAMQKYVFRDYALPGGAGSNPFRKDQGMASSMMSTRSFQAGYRSPFGGSGGAGGGGANGSNNPGVGGAFTQSGLGARPKKSYSMNRLDQLAQPRRRVEPKVPTSASFMKTKELLSGKRSNDNNETTNSSAMTIRGPKPTPPPKTLFKSGNVNSPKPTTSEPLSRSAKGSSSSGRKPRPLSQIETSSKSAISAMSASTDVPIESNDQSNGNVDDETAKAERLAEYKRQLAEKRALFRKQQEEQAQQKQQEPKKKAIIRKPDPVPVDETTNGNDSSSSSSSSSPDSSDNESENTLKQTSVHESVTAKQADEQPLVDLSSNDSQMDGQIMSDNVVQPKKPDLMSTSLNPDDFAALNINQPEQQHQQLDKALANASMTASFDGSLLSTGSTGSNGSRNQSATLTKEQLEERSAMLLQQERAEREKRKSRVQEILKRTRKEENSKKHSDSIGKMNGGGGGSGGESETDSSGPASNGVEPSSIESNDETVSRPIVNGNGNIANNTNGSNDVKQSINDHHHTIVGHHTTNGHHRDMKNFVNENEQSLPPTNGF